MEAEYTKSEFIFSVHVYLFIDFHIFFKSPFSGYNFLLILSFLSFLKFDLSTWKRLYLLMCQNKLANSFYETPRNATHVCFAYASLRL